MKELWARRVQEIFDKKEEKEEELYLNILSMMMYNRYNDRLSTVYKEFGEEVFSRLISILGGEIIEMPSEDDYRDAHLASLCFYFIELKGMIWDEVHEVLPFKDINSIKYGKWIARLSRDSIKAIKEMFEGIQGTGEDDEFRKYI